MVRDEGANPANLHEAGGKVKKWSGDQLVGVLPPEGLRVTKWKEAACATIGISSGAFYDYLPAAKALAEQRGQLWFKRVGPITPIHSK